MADTTDRIQQALDDAAARGGGVVHLDAGEHHITSLRLPSDVTLDLAAGAHLIADPADLPDVTRSVAEQSGTAILWAQDADDIAVTGSGTIDAQGHRYFYGLDDVGYMTHAEIRPRVLVFENCRRVRLTGITVVDSPMWTLHLVGCDDVTLEGLVVKNNLEYPNTDGVDIDGCQGVTITGCDISGADDAICLKTTRWADGSTRTCRDVTVTKCRVQSRSCALKIGTETHDEVSGVRFTDCEVHGSNRAFGIFSRDGGAITDVEVRSLWFECAMQPVSFWGCAEPVTISARDRVADVPCGAVTNVVLAGLRGLAEGALTAVAETSGRIAGLTITDVELTQTVSPRAQQGFWDSRPPVNPASRAGGGMDNAYHIEEGHDLPWGLVAYPGGLPGVYVAGAESVGIDKVVVHRPEPLPEGWNRQDVVVE